MKEKVCMRSCHYAGDVNETVNAVRCEKDGQWRGAGGVCPHKLDDAVNHPAHYTQGKVECLDAIESATTGLIGIEAVLTGQIIKYIWRWKWKNGQQDLEKARFYLNRLINAVRDGDKHGQVKDRKEDA